MASSTEIRALDGGAEFLEVADERSRAGVEVNPRAVASITIGGIDASWGVFLDEEGARRLRDALTQTLERGLVIRSTAAGDALLRRGSPYEDCDPVEVRAYVRERRDEQRCHEAGL